MAGIDDAVLKRRQLDLDKRTADLQKYFERLAKQKLAGMADNWRILDYRLRSQVKKMYQDLGALQDPKKIRALKGKIDRLEAYISQVQQDILRNGGQQQPYYTGILKHQLEKSYYMNAWAAEQAAKVTATVPALTPAQALGVLINPWLPDGANYSDRIRANTALLARDMKKVIQEAVEEGLDWNTVARNISAKTGEGYFRAVRLARTELNRAAALGASYSYLQNQDIMDGKRWNATLDSRTAPKDAANDGKIYDLEYDIPENKGVPGQRIPNHPNCRCIWSPVLSALGVNNRERIARGGGDTPRTFGERTYTKAGTYREYAKERGLPDLNDRINNDRLKAYLRPGENIVNLNQEVKRWTYQGKTIQVPKPDWVDVPKVIPPIVPPVPEVKQVAGGEFVPASSIDGANAWAKNNLGIETVNYKDFALDLANDVNKQLYEIQQRYPQALPGVKYVGTAQNRNRAFVDRKVKGVLGTKDEYVKKYMEKMEKDALARNPSFTAFSDAEKKVYTKMADDLYKREETYYKKLYKRSPISSNTWAEACNESWGAQAGITYNEPWAKDFGKLTASTKRSVSVKWHPEGTESPASILTHEYGHQLDYYLRREAPDLREYVIKQFRDNLYGLHKSDTMKHIKENLSEYATKNDAEFFAEAFAEWVHNPNPRPIAKDIGQRLDKALADLAKRKGATP